MPGSATSRPEGFFLDDGRILEDKEMDGKEIHDEFFTSHQQQIDIFFGHVHVPLTFLRVPPPKKAVSKTTRFLLSLEFSCSPPSPKFLPGCVQQFLGIPSDFSGVIHSDEALCGFLSPTNLAGKQASRGTGFWGF